MIKLVSDLFFISNTPAREINLYLLDKQTIAEAHAEFFNDPTPTDCMSFPMGAELDQEHPLLLGEILVCPRVAIEYASANHGNPYHELSLYIIHAFLHLLGYDDTEEEAEHKMRLAEQSLFSQIDEHGNLLRAPQ